MFLQIILVILVTVLGAFGGAIIGLLTGAFIGGNWFTDFVFNGVQGYEATGQIGALAGAFIGGIIAQSSMVSYFRRRRQRKQR